MPLPILAVVAARLGIKLATYMVRNQFKKGAAKKLRKVVTKKQAEIAKKKEDAGKGHKGKGSERKYPQQITKRTDRPPTKAQIEATKERNKTEWQRRAMDRGPGDLSIKKIKK